MLALNLLRLVINEKGEKNSMETLICSKRWEEKIGKNLLYWLDQTLHHFTPLRSYDRNRWMAHWEIGLPCETLDEPVPTLVPTMVKTKNHNYLFLGHV